MYLCFSNWQDFLYEPRIECYFKCFYRIYDSLLIIEVYQLAPIDLYQLAPTYPCSKSALIHVTSITIVPKNIC